MVSCGPLCSVTGADRSLICWTALSYLPEVFRNQPVTEGSLHSPTQPVDQMRKNERDVIHPKI